MTTTADSASRRDFLADFGRLASTAAIAACAPSSVASATAIVPSGSAIARGKWDLTWIDTVQTARDRAVFDWPSLGDPADPIVLEIAERYLDNCRAAYEDATYDARAVLNIRTQAIPAAMTDRLWESYSLGVEYNAKDPHTKQPATRNPFWHRAPDPAPGLTLPTVADILARGGIVLVCDFALGHLAKRLATKVGRSPDAVLADLRGGLVPGAYIVPSGIFGLARAQNSGCAYIRM